MSTISENVLSSEPMYKFLSKTPLKQLTFSRILHEYWRHFKIQTEDLDCESLIIVATGSHKGIFFYLNYITTICKMMFIAVKALISI